MTDEKPTLDADAVAALKARLLPLMNEGNRDKTAQAPVTVIVGMDMAFHDKLPQLFQTESAQRGSGALFGNAGGNSGAGVGFTRHPVSGEPTPWIDFLVASSAARKS